jgi:predicted RNase H-related nuclease YkuK (DUF458 family)
MGKRKPSVFDTVYQNKEDVAAVTKRKWHQPDKGKIQYHEMIEWIQNKLEQDEENLLDYHLIVGTDSQKRSSKVRFVTIVALYREGKGGMYFYTSHLLPREMFGKNKNDKTRIYQEVDYSVEVANELLSDLGELILPSVHVDASPKHKKEFTSDISDNLISMIRSYGFEPCIKPFSFAASSIANKHSKG